MNNFNEEDVRKFYRYFKHTLPTEIRVFDEKKYPNGKSVFVSSEDEFVEKCRYYCEEEEVSVYIGARDRKAKGDKNIISSHFVFFEIDEHEEGDNKDSEKIKILKFLENNNIKVGMQGMSGGGWHFYIPHKLQGFKDSEEALAYKDQSLNSFKRVFIEQGFDVDGAVFNLERVTRVMGTFNFKRGKISQIEEINEVDLEANTKALQELLVKYKSVPRTKDITYNFEDDDFIKSIKEKWVAPGREGLALSVAGYLRKEKKLGLTSTLSIIRKICEDCNDEEMESRLVAVRATFDKDEKEIIGRQGLIEKDICIDSDSTSVEFFLYSKGMNSKTGKEDFAVDVDKVADYIQSKFEIRTIYGLKEETIEIYKDGVWTVTGKGTIKSEVEFILKRYAKNNIVSEILEKVKRRSEVSREEADIVPDYKRCVENGVLDLEDVNNIKLLPHSKEYNFRHKFPMKYNPDATCPNNMKFFEEAFYQEDIPMVQEWIGFHLPRKYCFKKAIIIHGPKNTSKTVFVNLLTSFVGNNVSGLSLQEISGGKSFDLLALKDKDANIYDDLSSSDMDNVGGFKMAVGDGWISGEQKFGDKVRFRNTAKDTNTCNNIPSPKNDIDDMAYYERILLLPMDNVISKDKRDKDLIEKLTTPEELSGLLNWAIEGWKRLSTQNCFSNEKTPEETKFIMVQKGNSLAKFAAEVLLHQDGAKVEKDDMYKVYCKWCMEHNPQLSPDTKDKIGKTLTKFAPYTQASSTGKARYWSNVTLTDTYDTFLQTYRVNLQEDNDSKNDGKNISYNIFKPVIPVRESEFLQEPEESE